MYGLEIAAGHYLNVDFTSAPASHDHTTGFTGNREVIGRLDGALTRSLMVSPVSERTRLTSVLG